MGDSTSRELLPDTTDTKLSDDLTSNGFLDLTDTKIESHIQRMSKPSVKFKPVSDAKTIPPPINTHQRLPTTLFQTTELAADHYRSTDDSDVDSPNFSSASQPTFLSLSTPMNQSAGQVSVPNTSSPDKQIRNFPPAASPSKTKTKMSRSKWLPDKPVFVDGNIKKFPSLLLDQLKQYCREHKTLEAPCSAKLWTASGKGKKKVFQLREHDTTEWRIAGTTKVVKIGRFTCNARPVFKQRVQYLVVKHEDLNNGKPCFIQYRSGIRRINSTSRSKWNIWNPDKGGVVAPGIDCISGKPKAMRELRAAEEILGRSMYTCEKVEEDSEVEVSQSPILTPSPSIPELYDTNPESEDDELSLELKDVSHASLKRTGASLKRLRSDESFRQPKPFDYNQTKRKSTEDISSDNTPIEDNLTHSMPPENISHTSFLPFKFPVQPSQRHSKMSRLEETVKKQRIPVSIDLSLEPSELRPIKLEASDYSPTSLAAKENDNISEASSLPDPVRAKPTTTPSQASATEDPASVTFSFQKAIDGNELRSRPYDQCDSVHKLFGRALSAGVARPDTQILCVYISGSEPIYVNRGDEEDFEVVQAGIEEAKKIGDGGGERVKVVVVPHIWS